MGKKTRKRRKLSLKKQDTRRLQDIEQNELAEVSGGYELASTSLEGSYDSLEPKVSPIIIRWTARCETSGCF